jgi:hypothetical protein
MSYRSMHYTVTTTFQLNVDHVVTQRRTCLYFRLSLTAVGVSYRIGLKVEDRGGMQTRAFWGGGLRKQRASLSVAAGLTHLLATLPGHGRLGPSPQTPSPTSEDPCDNEMPACKRRVGKKLLRNWNWSDGQLRAALSAVERGSPIQTAPLDFDIPRTTLRNHVMGLSLSRKKRRRPVLSKVEEEKVVQYILGMARYGHPINITELKIKVAEATQLHDTPFKDGIPRAGWVRWFRKCHPEISVRMSQGLDCGRARGLCSENVSSFYENLEVMLAKRYEASHIWNCNELGAQVGRNGGGRVLAKTGARSIHSVILKEREWLSVLVCMNVAGYHIPNFYIFHGKSFQLDYI